MSSSNWLTPDPLSIWCLVAPQQPLQITTRPSASSTPPCAIVSHRPNVKGGCDVPCPVTWFLRHVLKMFPWPQWSWTLKILLNWSLKEHQDFEGLSFFQVQVMRVSCYASVQSLTVQYLQQSAIGCRKWGTPADCSITPNINITADSTGQQSCRIVEGGSLGAILRGPIWESCSRVLGPVEPQGRRGTEVARI